jgi:aminoglycoside phosphotransferase (APT) family kinase protein
MRERIDGGWDSLTHLVDGRWIEREPLRPEVEPGLRTETRLLPWLAPTLPLQVPVPSVVDDQPLRVRHRRVRGEPGLATDHASGRRLGQFLVALHQHPIDEAVARGVPDAVTSQQRLRSLVAHCRAQVLPLLPTGLAESGAALLDRVVDSPQDTLVHGDLGPEHLLVHVGRLHGVIDWSDVHVGDPALDLAWALNGSPTAFAEGVAETYGAAPAVLRRARDWHLLGPWHEVLHGLETDRPDFVASGLAGTRDRLRRAGR